MEFRKKKDVQPLWDDTLMEDKVCWKKKLVNKVSTSSAIPVFDASKKAWA